MRYDGEGKGRGMWVKDKEGRVTKDGKGDWVKEIVVFRRGREMEEGKGTVVMVRGLR